MAQMDPGTLIIIVTTLVAGIGMVAGAILPAIVEGRAALKALEGMTRQPEAANDLRSTMITAMALLETTAIYVLLVILALIFANPMLERFFPTG